MVGNYDQLQLLLKTISHPQKGKWNPYEYWDPKKSLIWNAGSTKIKYPYLETILIFEIMALTLAD